MQNLIVSYQRKRDFLFPQSYLTVNILFVSKHFNFEDFKINIRLNIFITQNITIMHHMYYNLFNNEYFAFILFSFHAHYCNKQQMSNALI